LTETNLPLIDGILSVRTCFVYLNKLSVPMNQIPLNPYVSIYNTVTMSCPYFINNVKHGKTRAL